MILPSLFGKDTRYDEKVLDYTFEAIKAKYLNPPQEAIKKIVRSKSVRDTNGGSRHVYAFDFSRYRLEKKVIRELQSAFEVTSQDIQAANNHFLKDFPFMRIPITNIDTLIAEKKVAEYLDVYGDDKKRFSEKKYIEMQMNHSNAKNKFELFDIKLLRTIIESPEVNKIHGLLLHFTNCMIFEKLQLIKMDNLKRKQMVVLIMNYFSSLEHLTRDNVKKRNITANVSELRLWSRLICPVMIINFKMICEYFYSRKCPALFKNDGVKQETIRLIFALITEVFDPSGLNGQVLFWHHTVDVV
jgi:hypothetical protein